MFLRRSLLQVAFPAKALPFCPRKLGAKSATWSVSPLLIFSSLAIICGLVLPAGLFGQNTLPASLERGPTLSPEKQTELQQELQRHMAVLDAQSAVLKTVAKLVGPSVVFVESERKVDQRQMRQQSVQEDGSGVIINWKGKFYILTNRHVIRDAPPEAIKIDLADGRRIVPEKIWGEEASDVAVMAISAPT